LSLIERAAGRIAETGREVLTPPTIDVSTSIPSSDSTVERAAAKLQTQQPDPNAVKVQAPPTAAQHAAPSMLDLTKARREPTLSQVSPQGMINLARLKQAGMITPDGERSTIAEEYRQIKRPLIMNAFNEGVAQVKNGNLIMVTSSLPGEGKSFSSVNLAMSIAMEMDHTVLLVDADVAKPSVPGLLGLKADRGLMDLLLDDSLQLSDVLIKTNVEKLTLLPAGRGHRYSTELLASVAMRRLIEEMGQRYSDRIIIFDSPPLLATSEARVLASYMGQIVVVVEAQKTTHEALREALKHLEHCEIVGMLLNKGNYMPGNNYYGSYYGTYGKQ
jgi:protein-tyrosine kinase